MSEQQPIEEMQQDQLQDAAIQKFEENKNVIYGGIAGLIFIIVAAYFYVNSQNSSNQKATEQAFKAQNMFERDSFNLALNGSTAKNFKGFLSIIDKYSSSYAANNARYAAAVSYLQIGNAGSALEQIQGFSSEDDYLQALAYNLEGDALSESGKFDAALSAYKKAAVYVDNEAFAPVFLYKAATLSEHQNKANEAIELYNQIQIKYPAAAEKLAVKRELIRLGSAS